MKLLLPLCFLFFAVFSNGNNPIRPLSFPNANPIDTIPCGTNVDCSTATSFGTPIVTETVCINGCTEGMPEQSFCNVDSRPAAWYSFNTGPNNMAVINLTAEFDNPVYTLLSDCDTVLECNPVSVNLIPNTTYYIVVSDLLGETGNFELCLTMLEVIAPCIKDETFIITGASMGSPLTGPFQPCEILTFKYSTNFFSAGDCQWLHNFIPYLSECWNNQQPNLIQYPAGTSAANFQWFPEGTVYFKPTTNNPPSAIGITVEGKLCQIGLPGCQQLIGGDGTCGTTLGTPLPGGWVVTNVSGTCGGSSNPNQSWGIQQGCNTNAQKSLTFQLAVPCNYCSSCDFSGEGLVVGMASLPDGATGGWNNPQCNGNSIIKKKIIVQCCTPPSFTTTDTVICSGAAFNPDLAIDTDNSTLEWEVANPFNIIGASAGNGDNISQILINSGLTPHDVYYHITATGPEGCRGIPETLIVKVLPAIRPNSEEIIYVCNEQPVSIEIEPSVGTGHEYITQWSTGETNINSILFGTNADTIITVTITDSLGCQFTDSIAIKAMSPPDIIKPADTSLIGNLIFVKSILQTFSVHPFDNATDYIWTLNGQVIGQGIEINYDFSNSEDGFYTLCVGASNCTPDSESLCWEIRVVTLGSKYAPVQTFKMYPNPNDGKFSIELPEIIEGSIEFYDLNGRNVHRQLLNNKNLIQKIDLKNSTPTIYNIIVRNRNGRVIGSNKILIK